MWPRIGSKNDEGFADELKIPVQRRILHPDGSPNVQLKNRTERRQRYLADFYTTIVDCSWWRTLFLLASSFVISWLFFAGIYYIICFIHGDLEAAHLPRNQSVSGWKPCISEMDNDFATFYLFSLDTQFTIGYGTMQVTTECGSVITVLSIHCIVGCIIEAVVAGLVFSKLSRPKQRGQMIVFSRHAVVFGRDGQLFLMFRVGNIRQSSFIMGTQISLKLIRRSLTTEGDIKDEIHPLIITMESQSDTTFHLIWPVNVVHLIDKNSPFYRHSPVSLINDQFELNVVVEGTIESINKSFQRRTSYLPRDIRWGHRFEPMVAFRRDCEKYQFDFAAFDSIFEVKTPLCSAQTLSEFYQSQQQSEAIEAQEEKEFSNSYQD